MIWTTIYSIRTYNIFGIFLLSYTLTQFIEITTGDLNFPNVHKSFNNDRISNAIPEEVLWIRILLSRQNIREFRLAENLENGEKGVLILQRATEYLYPIKIDSHAKWVMARESDLKTAERLNCTFRDRQEGITLYACEK